MADFNTNISGSLDSLRGAFADNSIGSAGGAGSPGTPKVGGTDGKKSGFADAVKGIENYISKVDGLQESSDTSIKDLLSENRDEEIVEYNTTDVELTYKIYERINQVMVVR